LQIDGALCDVVSLGDIAAKFTAFGFKVFETDGHNVTALKENLDKARSWQDGPVALIAHTVKGKGVSFMENQSGWHGKAPSDEQCDCGIKEIRQIDDPEGEVA
jgi:transketolase